MSKNGLLSMNGGEIYERQVFRVGRLTIITCIIMALCVPLLLGIMFGVFPPVKGLISGLITVSSFMIPLSIAEILAFYPILGASGMFISYTTGNISNLKLPCAAIAMEAADVKPNTKEGDVIATIAMSGSVIVSELLLVAGVILLVPMSEHLTNPVIKPAFDQILPALFGSLGAYFILKNYKLAVVPLVLGIGFALISMGLKRDLTAIAVPVTVFVSIGISRFFYKKGWVKGD